MDDKKINNISLVIALIILGIIGFFVYKNFISVDSEAKPNSNIKMSNDDLYKLGKEKFQMLYSKHKYNTNEFIFFKDEDVTINNLENQDALSCLYTFLSNEDKNKTGSVLNDCFLDKGVYTKENYPNNCLKENFDKSLLEEQYYNNFDSSLKVDYNDFFATNSQKCFITGTTYNCYLNNSDVSLLKYVTITNYDKAEINDNKLDVYSYLLTIRKSDNENYEAGVYSNASATNKIDDLSFFNGNVGDSISTKMVDDLINYYKDKITKYKSTFIKSNNNYVWQSTTIIK